MSEINQFIYIIRPTRLKMLTDGPTEQEQQVVARHFEHLSALAQEGTVFMAGRTQTSDERTFGIVILNSDSLEEAQILMESDPAVKEGVMSAELYPYRIAVMGTTD
ncbi:YciI family protein [Chloroflexota bacterium]